jgi:hypothetical protein
VQLPLRKEELLMRTRLGLLAACATPLPLGGLANNAPMAASLVDPDFVLKPHPDSGTQTAFDLVTLKVNGRLHQIGLRLGDELLRVNGIGFDTDAEAARAADELSSAEQLIVEIVRGGRRQILVAELADEPLSPPADEHGPGFRLEPAFGAGRFVGYRLRGLEEGGVFARLGLRERDIVHAIGGRVADSPEMVLGLARHALKEPPVALSILRDGRMRMLALWPR